MSSVGFQIAHCDILYTSSKQKHFLLFHNCLLGKQNRVVLKKNSNPERKRKDGRSPFIPFSLVSIGPLCENMLAVADRSRCKNYISSLKRTLKRGIECRL